MRVLWASEVGGLLSFRDAIQVAQSALIDWGNNEFLNAPRTHVQLGNVRLTTHSGACESLRTMGLLVHVEALQMSANTQVHRSSFPPLSAVYDPDTGDMSALIVGSSIHDGFGGPVHWLRTAAISAVATRYLAPSPVRTMALLGTGREAQCELEAHAALLPELELIKVYSRDPVRRQSFATSNSKHGNVKAVDSAQDALVGAQLVVLATNTNIPILEGDTLERGTLVIGLNGSTANLVRAGMSSVKRREIADSVFSKADRVIINSRQQAVMDEQGEVYDPVSRGLAKWDDILELPRLLVHKEQLSELAKTAPEELRVYINNSGASVVDVAIAHEIATRAAAKGIGLELTAPQVA